MAIKAILSSAAELAAQPEAVRGLYEEINGRWVLPVEGVVPASELESTRTKLAEFRDNNRKLFAELEDLKPKIARFDGIDPDEHRALKAEKDKLVKRGVKDADDLGVLIQQSIEKATKPLAEKMALIEEDRSKLKRDLDAAKLRDAIAEVGAKKGIKPKALSYVLDKARDLFHVADGKIAARDGVFSQARPTDPLTPDEWMDALVKTDDFLFEPSSGGGAKPGPGGNKPGAKQLHNPTPEEMGRHMDAIIKGDMVVVRS